MLTNLGSKFEEDLDVRTGGGVDYVMVAAADVTDELDIRTGGGQDIIGVYFSQAFEANINGNGQFDELENFGNSFAEFDFNSIEDNYFGGFAQMNAEARPITTRMMTPSRHLFSSDWQADKGRTLVG